MLKVRYHLQNGPHYMHWQFKDMETKEVFYHKPSDHVIKIYNCILHNNRKVADKIFTGENKDVCAWIKFKNMEIMPTSEIVPSWSTHIRYNPKVLPFWHKISGLMKNQHNYVNLDGMAFDFLYLCEKGVFFDPCRTGIYNPLD